jgi:hypothetical protein
VELSGKKLGLIYEGGLKTAYEGIAWTVLDRPGK